MSIYRDRKTGKYYFFNSLLKKWFKVIPLGPKAEDEDGAWEFEITTEEVPSPRTNP